MRFEGKTVLITGAAGTVGGAAAKAFFKEGANLALVDFNAEALEAFAGRENFGRRALLISADVTDESQAGDYVRCTVERFGSIHVFHNNAGITGTRSPITELDIGHFRKLMDVNVTGVLLGLKYVLRQMYAQGFGAVINTASQKGRVCAVGSGDYSASKSAVVMLTKVAALEAAEHNVRVNCVLPGIVHSEMVVNARKRQTPGITEAELEKIFSASVPAGRWCEPEEIAEAVMFLASDSAAYITGQELRVDGGTTACFM